MRSLFLIFLLCLTSCEDRLFDVKASQFTPSEYQVLNLRMRLEVLQLMKNSLITVGPEGLLREAALNSLIEESTQELHHFKHSLLASLQKEQPSRPGAQGQIVDLLEKLAPGPLSMTSAQWQEWRMTLQKLRPTLERTLDHRSAELRHSLQQQSKRALTIKSHSKLMSSQKIEVL